MEKGGAFFQFYISTGTPSEAENKRPAGGGESNPAPVLFLAI
jgi:hypothetical protein